MSRDDGCHKIGRSANPVNRAASLRCHLVWVIRTGDMVWLETYLHRAFDEYRKGGEWFDLPGWIVDELVAINEIARLDDVPAWIVARHDATYKEQRRKAEEARRQDKHIRIREIFIPLIQARAESLVQDLTQYINDAVRMRLEQEGHWPPPPKPAK